MKNIDLICVGHLKNSILKNIEQKLLKSARQNYNLKIIEVDDEKNLNISRQQEIEKVKNTEGKKIISKIKNGSYVITFEIDGKNNFKSLREIIDETDSENISMIIGGSLGISSEVCFMSDKKLSISNMTFPHQLMRMIVLEQFTLC